METQATAVDFAKLTADLKAKCEQLKEDKIKLEAEVMAVKVEEEKMQEKCVDFAKSIVDMNAKCDKLKDDKIKLEAQVMALKEKEQRMKEKCVKQKEKRVKVKEKCDLEVSKANEEGEKMRKKCWQLEVDKRKLEIELDARAAVKLRADEAEAQVQRLNALLEERDDTITELLRKIEALERRSSRLELEEKARTSELLHLKSLLQEEFSSIAMAEREKMKAGGQAVNSDECTASNDNRINKVMDNGNSQSSGERSSDVSHSEPQKESTDQVGVQLKGHNGQGSSSKMLGNQEVSFPAKSGGSINVLINDGSNKEYDDRIIMKCTTKEVESTPVVASDSPNNRNAENSVVPQRRKVEALGCYVEKQIGTKQCKSDGHSDRKLKWESAPKMFNAFTANDKLCMRSVCALYRKHASLGHWKNSLSSCDRGFKPSHETRGMALGELLTSGDPEGRLKKSVAEFERVDPCGLEDCREIARHHHLKLFAMYKNNLDPHFMPHETI